MSKVEHRLRMVARQRDLSPVYQVDGHQLERAAVALPCRRCQPVNPLTNWRSWPRASLAGTLLPGRHPAVQRNLSPPCAGRKPGRFCRKARGRPGAVEEESAAVAEGRQTEENGQRSRIG